MARTEHLPLYKTAYDLCLYFEQVVRNFSRYDKYTLGGDLRDGARRVLKLIVRANARRDKIDLLHDIREETEELKVMLPSIRFLPNLLGTVGNQNPIPRVATVSVAYRGVRALRYSG
jgi:hypothetical protein